MTDSLSPDNSFQTWVIRGSCQELPGAKSEQQNERCEDCDSRKEYEFLEALKHIHTKRPDINHDAPDWPCEDRCAVWLEPTKVPRHNDRLSILMIDLQRFRDDLDTIIARATHLHQLFHRKQNRVRTEDAVNSTVQGPDPGAAITGSNAEMPNQLEPAPQPTPAGLPRSILKAFKIVIILFMIKSKVYHAMIRGDEDPGFAQSLKIIPGWKNKRYDVALKGILRALHSAHGDLILNLTQNNAATIRLSAVGTECLAAQCMMNVQRGVLAMPPHTRTDQVETDESLRSDRTRPTRNLAEKMPEDVILRYANHLAKLELKARLKPQRGAFLEIRALEDELKALQQVNSMQEQSVFNLIRVLDPDAFRVTNAARRTRFTVEQAALRRGGRVLATDRANISRLIWRAENLRKVVKENIEVLDEGHGKAIRAFTLVTLFFLPL